MVVGPIHHPIRIRVRHRHRITIRNRHRITITQNIIERWPRE
jgi:hypothetical protein